MSRFALSMVAVAALMSAAVAHPFPECEPCDSVSPENLDSLFAVDKVRKREERLMQRTCQQ